jgi:hypothetical protein
MTEGEAKKKWCPMVRYLAVFTDGTGKRECSGGYNRGYENSGINKSLCLASECMMWRWKDCHCQGQCGLIIK